MISIQIFIPVVIVLVIIIIILLYLLRGNNQNPTIEINSDPTDCGEKISLSTYKAMIERFNTEREKMMLQLDQSELMNSSFMIDLKYTLFDVKWFSYLASAPNVAKVQVALGIDSKGEVNLILASVDNKNKLIKDFNTQQRTLKSNAGNADEGDYYIVDHNNTGRCPKNCDPKVTE